VDATSIEAAVEQVETEDELRTARELVRRRLPALARLDDATRTRRLFGMLARKGYSSAVASRAIRDEVGGFDGWSEGAD
jgi:regulatory protein